MLISFWYLSYPAPFADENTYLIFHVFLNYFERKIKVRPVSVLPPLVCLVPLTAVVARQLLTAALEN